MRRLGMATQHARTLGAWVRWRAGGTVLAGGTAAALVAGTLVVGSAKPAGAQDPVAYSYVANFHGDSVTEYAQGATGNANPVATISGSSTGLDFPYGVALDSSGDLFVSNVYEDSVTEYAPGASGNATPVATISGASTGLVGPTGLAFDTSGDLFVANAFGYSVTEYAPGASGNATPVATISGSSTGLVGPYGVALDSSGNLLVANGDGDSVTEYAPGANGNAAPVATISGTNTGLGAPLGVALNSSGDLLVANARPDSVTEYAPGANGNATPVDAISGTNTGLAIPDSLGLDSSGNLLVANFSNNSVTEYAPGASGNATPMATISGTNTGLNGPSGIAVKRVIRTPQITKSFGSTSIPLGGETTLGFTITNPNTSTALSGIGFTDPLPSGMVVAAPNNELSGSCDGGTIVAPPGSSSISLSDATLAGSSSCQFEVGVIGIVPGDQVNTTSAVTSNVGDGDAATASLEVSGCPDGETGYLLTATTNVGTIYGGFCVNPATGEGTYQQQGTSGLGQVAVNDGAGITDVSAQGTNLELQGKLALPFYNFFTEQQPLQASGKFGLAVVGI